ncbi:hypothetical protein T484DRAFT_1921062 [Baffinella frigidus]|nr:hypothetical protein T484DRAFT_1921062 [Cryptophyta sp. CCMP2293]
MSSSTQESNDHRVAMSPNNGRFVASVSDSDENWKLLDTATDWSPDGRSIATASHLNGHDVHTVDAESGLLRMRMRGNGDRVTDVTQLWLHVTWSPDGSKFASGSVDGTCRV